jgi:putative membrane protein
MHKRRLITLLAGTVAFAAAPLAQAQSSDPTTGTSTTGTVSLQGTDATFLRRALEGGREEVQRAEVAMRNAQRAEVRNVASTMHEEHRRSNEKLEQLASRKGWDVPAATDIAATDTAESDQQRRMGTGAAYDDNYLEEEIRHHRETIALYRAQTSSGSDPDLRQFAQDSLPTLEHHLEMLQGSLSAK